jgi:hypothetical protein
MASIIREKTTGDYFYFWAILPFKTTGYTYAVYGFNGTNFYSKEESNGTDDEGLKELSARFDYVENAPVVPILGPGFDQSFWLAYFDKLKNP